jgi:hypothetical protein
MNQRTYTRNHKGHNQRQLIEAVGNIDRKISRLNPCKKFGMNSAARSEADKKVERNQKWDKNGNVGNSANQGLLFTVCRKARPRIPLTRNPRSGKPIIRLTSATGDSIQTG